MTESINFKKKGRIIFLQKKFTKHKIHKYFEKTLSISIIIIYNEKCRLNILTTNFFVILLASGIVKFLLRYVTFRNIEKNDHSLIFFFQNENKNLRSSL